MTGGVVGEKEADWKVGRKVGRRMRRKVIEWWEGRDLQEVG